MADLEGGKNEALARVEASRKETAEAVSKILETSVKQAESVKRQVIGAAELDARNSQLKSLERAVTQVFDSAVEQISGLSGAAHEKSLARLIEEGLEVIGPKARVQCASKDKKAVAAAIRKIGGEAKLTLDDETVNSIGGVVLLTSDGSVRFDNTYEARLERMKPTLRKQVADLLTTTN